MLLNFIDLSLQASAKRQAQITLAWKEAQLFSRSLCEWLIKKPKSCWCGQPHWNEARYATILPISKTLQVLFLHHFRLVGSQPLTQVSGIQRRNAALLPFSSTLLSLPLYSYYLPQGGASNLIKKKSQTDCVHSFISFKKTLIKQ